MKRGSKRQTSMDKFIVRSPRESPASSPTKERGGLRQATLESLRGVVVVEDMERAVVVLERSDISTELKVDTLQHLLRKNPAKEVLVRTGLGKTVHKLCRSEDAEVAAAAHRVYRAWKKHILSKMNRPHIEVKCDLKTQRLRNSARQMLCDALQRENGKGGGGEGVRDNKERRKQSEAEDQKRSRDCNEVVIKERRDVQEEEEEEKEKEGKSDEIKSHQGTEDSDRKRDKRKQKEKEEEGGTGRTPKRQRQEEEEEEGEGKNRKRGGEKSQKQKEGEEGSEGGRTQKRKRQEDEIQEEEERKDREKCKKKNPAPTSNNLRQDNSTKHDSVEALAELIEREVYQSSQRRVDNSYRRTIRALVFTLRHQGEVRRTVSSATLSVPDFVKQYRKS